MAQSDRVSLGDIEGKLREVSGGAASSLQSKATAPPVMAVGGVFGVLAVAGVYLLGRRRGKKESPILEIRRI